MRAVRAEGRELRDAARAQPRLLPQFLPAQRALAIHGGAPCSRQLEQVDPAFREDVLAGLSAPIPAVPARWLYDRRGSELFDEITRLPTYYPTRTETALLKQIMPEIAARIPAGTAVVEFGAGSATKTPLAARGGPARGLCAGRHFRRLSARERRRARRRLSRRSRSSLSSPISRDPFDFRTSIDGLPKLGFFPGSTIGNFVPRSATDLLRSFRDLLGIGAQLLIGMDRVKPVERLIAAYDDRAGRDRRVQPQPARADQPRAGRRHPDRRLPPRSALERHSRRASRCTSSRRATSSFTIDGRASRFAEGSSIHTENSHKYGRRGARVLLLAGGWTPLAEWTDPAGDFAVILAEALPNRFAP